jgi:hypothetical protein
MFKGRYDFDGFRMAVRLSMAIFMGMRVVFSVIKFMKKGTEAFF